MEMSRVRFVALALVVSVGIVSCTVFAAFQAPQLAQASASKAKKETVYVVTSVKTGFGGKDAYSYNKKGLVSKRISKYDGGKNTLTWKYDKSNNLKSIARANYNSQDKSTFKENATYKTTKAGVLKSEVAGNSDGRNTFEYKSSKGLITSRAVRKTTGSRLFESAKRFTYKKGRMATMRYMHVSGLKGTFSYDSKGNLKKFTYGGSTCTFKNTYAKGRLKSVKRQLRPSRSKRAFDYGSFSYTYKAMKVPADTAAKVKEQQWAILNSNLNYALGGDEMVPVLGPSLFGVG